MSETIRIWGPHGVLPCMVCNRQLPSAAPAFNQPSEGVAFQAPGHYGSQFWDPMDGSVLEITVCDSCLRARCDRTAMIAPTAKGRATT